MNQTNFNILKKVMQTDPGSGFYQFVISCKGFEFIDKRTGEIVPRWLIHNSFTPGEIQAIKDGYSRLIEYRQKPE